MPSALYNTFHIYNAEIHLSGNPDLVASASDYLCLLYHGVVQHAVKPQKFELHLVDALPSVPSDAVRIIEGPVSIYSRGGDIFFISRDGGSCIKLDPTAGEAEGLFSKHALKDSSKISSLVGSLIVEILRYQGLYFLHAACVYGNGRAYLFSGDGGTGKTTASLSLVLQGFQYVADDSLFFSEHNEQIVVSPFYTHFHVDETLAACFPGISGTKTMKGFRDDVTKVRVNMPELFPDLFVPSLSPDYIIFPRIVLREKSAFSPLNQTEVYIRLLKQIILAVDALSSLNQVKTLAKLVKQVKGYELFMGKDMYGDPRILAGLLAELDRENESTQEIQS